MRGGQLLEGRNHQARRGGSSRTAADVTCRRARMPPLPPPSPHHSGASWSQTSRAEQQPLYSVVVLMMSESPGSVMASTLTRKYLPHAVPRSTLSAGRWWWVARGLAGRRSGLFTRRQCWREGPWLRLRLVNDVIRAQRAGSAGRLALGARHAAGRLRPLAGPGLWSYALAGLRAGACAKRRCVPRQPASCRPAPAAAPHADPAGGARRRAGPSASRRSRPLAGGATHCQRSGGHRSWRAWRSTQSRTCAQPGSCCR